MSENTLPTVLEEIVAELRQDDERHQADLDARVRSLNALDAKVKSLLPAHRPLPRQFFFFFFLYF